MVTLISVLILLLCIVLILVILVQNPKGGLAANFSSSNQVLGARKTADFMEKTTWSLGIALLVLSIVSTSFAGSPETAEDGQQDTELREQIDDAASPIQNAPLVPENAGDGERPPVPAGGQKQPQSTPPAGGQKDQQGGEQK